MKSRCVKQELVGFYIIRTLALYHLNLDLFLVKRKLRINPFLANVPILYPLKTTESSWLSGVFSGYKMGTLARNGVSSNKERRRLRVV